MASTRFVRPTKTLVVAFNHHPCQRISSNYSCQCLSQPESLLDSGFTHIVRHRTAVPLLAAAAAMMDHLCQENLACVRFFFSKNIFVRTSALQQLLPTCRCPLVVSFFFLSLHRIASRGIAAAARPVLVRQPSTHGGGSPGNAVPTRHHGRGTRLVSPPSLAPPLPPRLLGQWLFFIVKVLLVAMSSELLLLSPLMPIKVSSCLFVADHAVVLGGLGVLGLTVGGAAISARWHLPWLLIQLWRRWSKYDAEQETPPPLETRLPQPRYKRPVLLLLCFCCVFGLQRLSLTLRAHHLYLNCSTRTLSGLQPAL